MTLAVNKIDTAAREELVPEFYSLGIRDVYPVSAEHGLGVDALVSHVTEEFPAASAPAADSLSDAVRVAIIGRPNVGKSTLLNALTGSERAIVSPVAGTTRDAVDEAVVRNGQAFEFVDTAGIRRKGKTHEMAEKLSVVMARRHIRLSQVVLLVLDASEGVLSLDATIAGYAHEGGRAVIVCVNKWDLIGEGRKRAFERDLRDELKFLDYAPIVFLSALKGDGVLSLFRTIKKVYDAASNRVGTGEINRFLEALRFEERKIYYMTQAGVRPPTFVLFTNKSEPLHFSDERRLTNQIRKRFGFHGTPVVLKVKFRKK